MIIFFYKSIFFSYFTLIFFFNSFVFCDIASPTNYQPIRYSQIRLEINYGSINGFVKNDFDFTNQNTLVTIISSKKTVYVSGRLLVAKSEHYFKINGTSRKSLYNIDGACSRITTVSETPWIALVLKGGQCSIKEKLDNVLLRSNATAVIILDKSLPRNADKYEFHNEVGLLIHEPIIPMNILLNESIFINASIIVNNLYIDGLISRTSVLFVSISFILLMVISLVWLIFYYIQRFRYMHAKERLSRRLANAAKKALDKIPLKILSAYDNEVSNDYDQCAICIDNYNVGETIRILPCKHIFHKICIDSWLIEQRSCPMCKVDILKACGVLNVSSSGKLRDMPSLINHSLWVRNTTVTTTAAILEAGFNGNVLAMDSLGSHPNSRCRRGHSTFLQRYRERYGLYHCHRGHRRDHFQKLSRHFHEHRCTTPKNKFVLSKVDLHPTENCVINNNQLEPERIDLISESEHSIVSQQDTSICVSFPDDKDSKFSPHFISKNQELQEITNSTVYDICECSSDNTNVDSEACVDNKNNSHKASMTCSCETCSDCLYMDTDCDHYNCRMKYPNQGSSLGNLLTCCMTSNTNINNVPNDSISGLYCCNPCTRCRSSMCSSCNSKTPPNCKKCLSKSGHTKCGNYHFASNLESSPFSQTKAPKPSLRPSVQNRQAKSDNYESVKRLKSIVLVRGTNKNGTIDSYAKSSISDDFDYEADNGSSSLEVAVPAIKLTVLPPQVQCHQGSLSSDCAIPDSSSLETHYKSIIRSDENNTQSQQ